MNTQPVPSRGVRQLLVAGMFAVRDGELDTEAMPGGPILSVAGSDQD